LPEDETSHNFLYCESLQRSLTLAALNYLSNYLFLPTVTVLSSYLCKCAGLNRNYAASARSSLTCLTFCPTASILIAGLAFRAWPECWFSAELFYPSVPPIGSASSTITTSPQSEHKNLIFIFKKNYKVKQYVFSYKHKR